MVMTQQTPKQIPKICCYGRSKEGGIIIGPTINMSPILTWAAVRLNSLRFKELWSPKIGAFLQGLEKELKKPGGPKITGLVESIRNTGITLIPMEDGKFFLKIPPGRPFSKNPETFEAFIDEVNISLQNPSFLSMAMMIAAQIQKDADDVTAEILRNTLS
jgi:hypothetical protein